MFIFDMYLGSNFSYQEYILLFFYFQVRIRSMYQELLLTFSELDEALKAKALMLVAMRPPINYSEFDYGH